MKSTKKEEKEMRKFIIIGKQKTNTKAVCVLQEVGGKGNCKTIEVPTTKTGICNLMLSLLSVVRTNEEELTAKSNSEMATVYVADAIGKAITNGSIGTWLRDKKAGTGNALTSEELKLVTKMYVELGKKNLNIKVLPTSILNSKYNTDTDSKNAVKRCWAILDKYELKSERKSTTSEGSGASASQKAIDSITEQIVKASIEGNFELVAQLNKTLEILSANSSNKANNTESSDLEEETEESSESLESLDLEEENNVELEDEDTTEEDTVEEDEEFDEDGEYEIDESMIIDEFDEDDFE